MMIDFLSPEEETTVVTTTDPVIPNPVTPDSVVPSKDPVDPVDPNIPILDLINEPTEDPANPTIVNDNVVDYSDALQSLLEKGIISDFPETFNNAADRGPVTVEELNEVLEYNTSLKETRAAENTFNTILGKMSPELQKAYEYEAAGGNPADYLKVIIETRDLKGLDPTKVSDQEIIVREFYKNSGLEPEDINEKITDLKDAALLEKEASKLKPKLDKRAEDIAQEKMMSQRAVAEQKIALSQVAANRITEKLVKGVDSIKFNKEEANELLSSIMLEQSFKYGEGNVQTKTTLEYLIDYHKYSTDGDPSRVIKALMILDPKGRFDEKFAKSIKNDMVNKFTADHIKDSKSKFQINPPTPAAPAAKPKTKFQFQ